MLGSIKTAAKAVAGLAGDALTGGLDRVQASLDELSAASADLEQVGYLLGDVELVASLPPRVVVYLTRTRPASAEAFQAVIANRAGNNPTLRTVLGLLQTADGLIERFKLQGRRCSGVALELSVPPSIRLVYAPCPAGPAPGA